MSQNLRLALQKSGRLGDDCLDLLKKSGFNIRQSDRMLQAFAKNFPLEILFLRGGDIVEVVADGIADLGIVGQNTLEEKPRGKELKEQITLGFGDCRLVIAAPKQGSKLPCSEQKIEDLNITSIATSHPNILREFLDARNISAEIVPMSGSVEIAPALEIADVICDLVSSGATLKANGLREVETIFTSEAVLVSQKQFPQEKQKMFEEFLLRISSVLDARSLKSVTMNLPVDAISKIENVLPALSSPTISPLAKKGWVAVHTVISEDGEFWDKIKKLKEAGASGILVSPIERVIY